MREGWTYKKLGEITKVINGLWIGKKPPLKTVAVIRNTNFTKDCKLSTTNIAYIDVEEKQFEKRRLLQGDIIIEKSGGSEKQPVGRPILFNLIGGEFSFSNFTSVIRIDNPNEIISSFLHLALYGAYLRGETLKMQAKTTGIHNLDFKAYNRILIPIPSLQEQQQIVSELDLLSSVIEKQKAQIEDLDKLAQSIFYDMFGDPVENEKGWEVKKLGILCEIGTGATPSRTKEDLYYGGNIPWVKTTEVCYQDIYDTEEKITPLAIKETNCKVYPVGTLLMAMYGQGKTRGQVAKLMVEAATNQACAAIQVDNKIIHIDYLYALMIIKYDSIRAMAQGGNQANLNMKLVGSIPVPIPPLSLQQEFADKIQAIESMKAKVRQSLKESETLFNSRMDYYFN